MARQVPVGVSWHPRNRRQRQAAQTRAEILQRGRALFAAKATGPPPSKDVAERRQAVSIQTVYDSVRIQAALILASERTHRRRGGSRATRRASALRNRPGHAARDRRRGHPGRCWTTAATSSGPCWPVPARRPKWPRSSPKATDDTSPATPASCNDSPASARFPAAADPDRDHRHPHRTDRRRARPAPDSTSTAGRPSAPSRWMAADATAHQSSTGDRSTSITAASRQEPAPTARPAARSRSAPQQLTSTARLCRNSVVPIGWRASMVGMVEGRVCEAAASGRAAAGGCGRRRRGGDRV